MRRYRVMTWLTMVAALTGGCATPPLVETSVSHQIGEGPPRANGPVWVALGHNSYGAVFEKVLGDRRPFRDRLLQSLRRHHRKPSAHRTGTGAALEARQPRSARTPLCDAANHSPPRGSRHS